MPSDALKSVVAVLLLQAVVLAGLWFLQRAFL